jgi:hypothetical protein
LISKQPNKPSLQSWIEAYKSYLSPNPPVSGNASPAAAATPLNSDQAWVNTKRVFMTGAAMPGVWMTSS